MSKKKLVVVGGGAAGFFCAVNAARMNPSLDVTIIEKTKKLLSKVRISGGGRCNTTHACFDIDEMIRRYPRGSNFVKKTFHQFFTKDTIAWFAERGVELKAESDGRMFPVTNSSQTIIDCLLGEAGRYGVKVMTNVEVRSIKVQGSRHKVQGLEFDVQGSMFNVQSSTFNVQFSDGGFIDADFVCVASGGYPKSSMFEWLQQMGHSIEEPVPSLFTFNMPQHPITKLMGVSVEAARVKIVNTKLEQEGPLLITHWGLSGPAILKLSAWGARQLAVSNWQFDLLVNWLPGFNEQQMAEKLQSLRYELASQKMINRNPFGLPQRLWEFLLVQTGVHEEKRWADLPAKEQHKLARNLCASSFSISGKTTFKRRVCNGRRYKAQRSRPEYDDEQENSELILCR